MAFRLNDPIDQWERKKLKNPTDKTVHVSSHLNSFQYDNGCFWIRFTNRFLFQIFLQTNKTGNGIGWNALEHFVVDARIPFRCTQPNSIPKRINRWINQIDRHTFRIGFDESYKLECFSSKKKKNSTSTTNPNVPWIETDVVDQQIRQLETVHHSFDPLRIPHPLWSPQSPNPVYRSNFDRLCLPNRRWPLCRQRSTVLNERKSIR